MAHVLVVGGGLLGTAAGYHLARDGHHVTVWDDQRPGRATDAGAGILSGDTTAHPHGAYVALARAADAYYSSLAAELGSQSGYSSCRLLIVGLAGEEEAFDLQRDVLRKRGSAVSDWDVDASPIPFPGIGHVTRALVHEHGARVEGRRLTRSLRAAAEACGARFLPGSVEALDVRRDGQVSARVGTTEVVGDFLVLAAGAWSEPLARLLHLNVPVVPHRGQIAHLKLHAPNAFQWPILVGLRGHYLLPWPDGRIVAGATRETDPRLAPELTAAGQLAVLEEALRVAPGLADAQVLEWRVGLRPASPDGLPIVGPFAQMPNVLALTGHGPGGLLLGPLSAKLIADFIAERPTGLDLRAFSPDRFQLATSG